MDELTTVRTFLSVVEHGSFSAAARQKNMTVSSIARQVNALEGTLGVRLLNRTTRHQSLTEAGALYYDQVRAVVRELDTIRHQVASYQDSVKGTLRVQLRTSVATQLILPAVPAFLGQYPGLRLDIHLSDHRADLVENGFDLAVWLGNLQDSNLIARQLSPSCRVVCGSPRYFDVYGEPRHPGELARHNCILYDPDHYGRIWRFRLGEEAIEVPVAGNLQTSSSAALLTAAVGGLGLIVAQEWMVRTAIAEGALRQILNGYSVRPTDFDAALYVVYPHSSRLSPKTRVFVEFLVGLFKTRQHLAKAGVNGSASRAHSYNTASRR
jgi:DNA-binding transcriptional LysR family regulator